MKIYLAGPMTGIHDYNYPAFHEAFVRLSERGYDVINPARFLPNTTMAWSDYLRRGLADVLCAGEVALLPGWEDSKGARLEVYVAQSLGMPCRRVEVYLGESEGPKEVTRVLPQVPYDSAGEPEERSSGVRQAGGRG